MRIQISSTSFNPLLLGKTTDALQRADGIVLSEFSAKKYFGQEDPIGRTLLLNDTETFTVSGVFKGFPHNSHLNVDIILSTLKIQFALQNVTPFQQSTVNYFKVRNGTSVSRLESDITREFKIHWNFEEGFPGSVATCYLQPLAEVAFRVSDNDVFAPKSKYTLQVFQIVSLVF